MVYNICCQCFDRDTYLCNSSRRKKFLGVFKRECVYIHNLFSNCELKIEYPNDRPPIPFLPQRRGK